MTHDELTVILCDLRDRTAGDPEAYARAKEALAEMVERGELEEGGDDEE